MTGNIPVAQTPVDGLFAFAHSLQGFDHQSLALFIGGAVKLPGIHHEAGFRPGFIHGGRIKFLAFSLNNNEHIQPELAREIKIALIMRGNSHDRSRAVFGQDKIPQPDGNTAPRKRIEAIRAGEDAILFQCVGLTIQAIHIPGTLNEGTDFRFIFPTGNERFHQGMLGCERHERHAEHRIRACGEHFYFPFPSFKGKDYLRANGFTDPVALHGKHAIRPAALQFLQIRQQFIRIGGNA